MALKTIMLPNTTVDDLVTEEAAGQKSKTGREYYIKVAHGFGLPPKGCPHDRYLAARAHAASIWDLWSAKEPQLKIDDPTLQAVLKAASIFELANYLISMNIENGAIINPSIGSFDYFLRSPLKKADMIIDCTMKITAIDNLLDGDNLPPDLSIPVRSYRAQLINIKKRAQKKLIFVFDGDRFIEKSLPPKQSAHTYAINKLLSNLCEIIKRVWSIQNNDFTYEMAQKVLLNFSKLFVSFRDKDSIELNEVSLKERLKVQKRNGLKAFEKVFESALKLSIE